MAKVFNSSKTFVDMKLKQPPEVTLELFEEFMAEQEDRPTRDSIRKFVAVSKIWAALFALGI